MANKEQVFYWEIISIERAKKLFQEGKTEIYQLFDDETEALILEECDILQAHEWGNDLAFQNPI
jgi:hypothetical protein